jgi:hypothetical protein
VKILSLEIWIQKIWTILERLQVNGCVLSNYLQGMLLLKAIPEEWDTVAQMYCNGMQMANVTFDGVRDAIMAEFEHTVQLALPSWHTRQIKYLLLSIKVSLPISKSRESQTQLSIQPLKLLMVSQALSGQGRVVNKRRLVKPKLPTIL